jgi:hypothetical protein
MLQEADQASSPIIAVTRRDLGQILGMERITERVVTDIQHHLSVNGVAMSILDTGFAFFDMRLIGRKAYIDPDDAELITNNFVRVLGSDAAEDMLEGKQYRKPLLAYAPRKRGRGRPPKKLANG